MRPLVRPIVTSFYTKTFTFKQNERLPTIKIEGFHLCASSAQVTLSSLFGTMREIKVVSTAPDPTHKIEEKQEPFSLWRWLFVSSKKDPYLKQIWPLLMIYRFLCRFPFRRRKDGGLEMKMISVQTAIFAVGYVGQTYLVMENVDGILNLMFYQDNDFAEIVTGGLNLCILAIHLFVPFSVFKEWKLLCEVYNKWIVFQEHFKTVFGEEYSTKNNLLVKIVAVVIPLVAFGVTVGHESVLYHKEWYHLLSYILIIVSVCILYAIWTFLLAEVVRVADKIRHRGFEVIGSDSKDKAIELYGLRILWHDMSTIVRFSSTAVACSMIFTSATGVVIFIASAYGFMQCINLGDERYFLFFSIMCAMGLVLCVPCEIGYRATLHMGTYMVEMLSSVNLMEQDEFTSREVDLFLQAVFANYPDVSYGGMVKINRMTITSLLSATMTYLIVLLQLRISKPDVETTSSSADMFEGKTTLSLIQLVTA